jgi:cysteine synthase
LRSAPDLDGVLGHIGDTPLVALGPIATGLDVPILVKCEHLNPGGSVKDRIALAIVIDAEGRGALRPGETIVEATASRSSRLRAGTAWSASCPRRCRPTSARR